MNTRISTKPFVLIAATLLVATLATANANATQQELAATQKVEAQNYSWTSPTLRHSNLVEDLKAGKRRLKFDVVEFGTKFAFDEAPVDKNGMPIYGNPFITQGVIYPAGVIKADKDGNTNGVIIETDADGNSVARPEFPELVVGLWICRGTVFAESFNIETGPTVHSSQLYDFHDVSGFYGKTSFTSTGLELIDLNVPIQRGIVGGTGQYKRAGGELKQTFIGVNASDGFALRFDAKIR